MAERIGVKQSNNGSRVPDDVSHDEDVRVGAPFVEGAKVVGEIISQIRGPKITVFKMKRRKGYSKKTGHRQDLTNLKIKEIVV